MRKSLALAAFCFLTICGCNPPQYTKYTSAYRDFKVNVPWAWNVMSDAQDKTYVNTTFIGPFETEFYLGAPTLSIRWYSNSTAHKLPDGRLELYKDGNDYIRRTLDEVYGPDRVMAVPVHQILVGGTLKAKHFVVLSAGRADPKARWGTAIDSATGRTINPRKHAYVVLPMRDGFYVLVYPATEQGYAKYQRQFEQLVNSFTVLKDGPGGEALPASPGKRPSR
jgi:hypothetical protein